MASASPANILGVMVSSTFTDLEDHRAALIKALHGQEVFGHAMENDSAKPINVIDSSFQMVRKSTAYFIVLGHKYGQVPDDKKRNPDKLSITELEFNEAQRLGLPIFLFLMSRKHSVTVDDVETDPVKRVKLAAFKERAKLGSIYHAFDSLADFAIHATQSVAELRRDLKLRTASLIPQPAAQGKAANLFVSYSHKDRKFLDQLLDHLKPLQSAGRVTTWSDKAIQPGAQWRDDIKQALDSSKAVVMLVTSSFLASDFIHEHELAPVLKKAEAGGLRVLWVLVRACSFNDTALKNYQALLPTYKPIAEMKAERDRAWVQVCAEIKKALDA